MERSLVRPECAKWIRANRTLSDPVEIPDLTCRVLSNPLLVKPEVPSAPENRAQFGLPTTRK